MDCSHLGLPPSEQAFYDRHGNRTWGHSEMRLHHVRSTKEIGCSHPKERTFLLSSRAGSFVWSRCSSSIKVCYQISTNSTFDPNEIRCFASRADWDLGQAIASSFSAREAAT